MQFAAEAMQEAQLASQVVHVPLKVNSVERQVWQAPPAKFLPAGQLRQYEAFLQLAQLEGHATQPGVAAVRS